MEKKIKKNKKKVRVMSQKTPESIEILILCEDLASMNLYEIF